MVSPALSTKLLGIWLFHASRLALSVYVSVPAPVTGPPLGVRPVLAPRLTLDTEPVLLMVMLPAPCLGVWHMGEAEEGEEAGEAAATEAAAADAGELSL